MDLYISPSHYYYLVSLDLDRNNIQIHIKHTQLCTNASITRLQLESCYAYQQESHKRYNSTTLTEQLNTYITLAMLKQSVARPNVGKRVSIWQSKGDLEFAEQEGGDQEATK
jgi:hypothetical protein